jgi:NADPH:quinone reductase-like Zn-dependent oxidoreductase
VNKKLQEKQVELAEYIAEMNDLIEIGALKEVFDFQLWLEDVKKECVYCFQEISAIAKIYMQHL